MELYAPVTTGLTSDDLSHLAYIKVARAAPSWGPSLAPAQPGRRSVVAHTTPHLFTSHTRTRQLCMLLGLVRLRGARGPRGALRLRFKLRSAPASLTPAWHAYPLPVPRGVAACRARSSPAAAPPPPAATAPAVRGRGSRRHRGAGAASRLWPEAFALQRAQIIILLARGLRGSSGLPPAGARSPAPRVRALPGSPPASVERHTRRTLAKGTHTHTRTTLLRRLFLLRVAPLLACAPCASSP